MKFSFITLALLSLSALAIENNAPTKTLESPGDEQTGSSAGYHNTELNSNAATTDFGSTIIRSQKEEAIDITKRGKKEAAKKKAEDK